MKTLFIYLYFLFSSLFLIQHAQGISDSNQLTQVQLANEQAPEALKITIDSTTAQSAFQSAWNVALLLTGGGQFIPGLPNSILYAILSLVIGLFFRRQEKKKLRAMGRLFDRSPNPAQEKQNREPFFKNLIKKIKRKNNSA